LLCNFERLQFNRRRKRGIKCSKTNAQAYFGG
jgi:hypothetical protein